MKNLSFLLLIVYLSLSAQEKGRPESAFDSSSPSAKRTGNTNPSKEKPYKEFPTDAKKGIQIVSEEEQKSWSSSKRVALIVGVSAYPLGSGLSRLNFGASDSQKMASVLRDVGRFDEVVLLNDEAGITDPALSPKKENIIRERNRLLSLNPHLFLFYFSGHGFELKGDNVVTPIDTVIGKEKEEPKNVLNIAKEIIDEARSYRSVKSRTKAEDEENLPEKKEHYGVSQVIVFLDACRETLRDGRSGSGVKFSEFPERIRSAKGVGIFIGTSPGGYSYEDGKLGGGVFTHFIVQGMSGEVQNKGGEYVTFNDLKTYVETEMAEYIRKKGKNEQAPYAKGDYTGDFLLAVGRPGKEVRVDAVQYRSKSGDRVDSKRIYDSLGRKLRLSFHNISDDGNIYPAALDGISQLVFKYNDKCFLPPAFPPAQPPAPHEGSREGRDCFEAHQFDRQGNLDFRHAVRYNPDRGWEIRRSYRDEPGTRKADRREKETEEIQYQRLEFDFNGNPILNEYQGEYIADKETGVPQERPVKDSEGIARVVQNFDLLSNKTLEEYYDNERKLKPNNQGIARTIFAYDSIGNPILKIYTNERGRQVKDSFEISKISYAYDYSKNPYGILLEKSQFGKSEEELAEGEDGLSRYEYRYNAECLKTFSKTKEDAKNFRCVEEMSYRGKDDQYKGNDRKIALSRFQYDEKGRLIEEKYFRSNENPMTVKEGITGLRYKYDEICWNYMKEVHPELLVPKCRETDSVCRAKEELVHTCVSETRTFNSAGAPEADYDGIAVYKYRYDTGCMQYIPNKKECLTVSETLDIRERPTLYPKERTVVHYDENCLRRDFLIHYSICSIYRVFYNADGRLTKNPRGNAGLYITKFDKNGNEILSENYGLDGKLTADENGYARRVFQYDENGNKILEEYYGTDGQWIERYGYARKVHQYDGKGNLTLTEYYGKDGNLRESHSGYARIVMQYNEKGKRTLEEYYNARGKLTGKGGYARKIMQYDRNEKQILEEYYDADEKLIEYSNGTARYIVQYNERGEIILEEFYGKNGKLKENNLFNYARKLMQYNENGNQTSVEYYDADGKLKNLYDRCAKRKTQYDEKGNQIRSECRGADGRLKEEYGYAVSHTKYDKNGNQIYVEYYGTNGELMENDDGYARLVMQYGKGDRLIREGYFGKDGQSKENIYGYAQKGMQYDDKGKLTIEEYFGSDGKLKVRTGENYGYARQKKEYDEQGRPSLVEFFGADEKRIERKSFLGEARSVLQFNLKGQLTLIEIYGADGKLKENPHGISRVVTNYDDHCLDRSKEHIKKNQSCLSYEEKYNKDEIIKSAYKNIFNSSGEFMERIDLTDLVGTKKWNHTNGQFRFEEKIEDVKEKRTVQKDGKFEEEEVSFPVLKEGRYFLEFPNPKGGEGKRKVIVELDKLYRPVSLRFE